MKQELNIDMIKIREYKTMAKNQEQYISDALHSSRF